MTKLCGIYCLTNHINNKRYIGQSIDIKYQNTITNQLIK